MTSPRHICDLLEQAAHHHGDKPAFSWPHTTLTWSELAWDVRAVAGALNTLGIQPGDNVAVLLPDLPLHPILSFAAPMIGAIYLPLNSRRSLDDIARLLQMPAPSVVFIEESMREALTHELHLHDLHLQLVGVREDGLITTDNWPRDALPMDGPPVGGGDDIAVRRLSPGVSREVRVIPLTHASLLHAASAVRKALQVLPSDTLLGTFPFFTSCGHLIQTLLPAWVGGTVHVATELPPHDILDALEGGSITAFLGGARQFSALRPELRDRLAKRDSEHAVQAEEADRASTSEAPAVSGEPTVSDLPAEESATTDAPDGTGIITDQQTTAEPDPAVAVPAAGSERPEQSVEQSDEVVDGNASETDQVKDGSEAAAGNTDSDTADPHAPTTSTPRHVRFALCAGAHADMRALERFEEAMGCPVATAYGVVESSGIIAIHATHIDHGEPGSLGRPVSGVEVEIRDPDGTPLLPGELGEIWVRGPNLFHGYEGHTETGLVDGWFATSDLGVLDEQHRLDFVCRKQDLISRGGFPVAPGEVETVLMLSPQIAESAVVGVPDVPMGEQLVAFVVPEPNAEIDDHKIMSFCSEHLPKYKIPVRYIVRDELPRSPNGFIIRRQLREDARTL